MLTLHRYPVKSMQGEELETAAVSERGLAGDRAYALVDAADGKVASAKNPRKWGKLFEFRASFVTPPDVGAAPPTVRVTLPDGRTVMSDHPDASRVLSEAVGREARLMATAPEKPTLEEYWPDMEELAHRETVTDEEMAAAAPPGTFFDCAAIHVLTTATLARLQQLYPQGRFDVRRFRPNLVVETPDGAGFVENEWVGRVLDVGDDVRLQVIIPCPRCVMTTLPQGDLPADPGILKTAAQHNRVHIPDLDQAMPSVGVYAVVVQGGTVRRRDPVRLE